MESQEQRSQRSKKSVSLLLLLILLVTVTVGFAVLSTTLNIQGKSKIAEGEWCVGPECGESPDPQTCPTLDAEDPDCGIITCPASENCIIVDCNTHPDHCTCDTTAGTCTPDPIDCTTDPSKCKKPNCTVTATETCACTASDTNCVPNPLIWLDGDTVKFKHTLQKPKEVFTFNTKYSNGGNIDAKVKNINKTEMNATAQQFMTYEVAYDDDSAIAADQVLAAGASAIFKVTVTYKDVQTLPTAAQLAAINEDGEGAYSEFSVNYEQN